MKLTWKILFVTIFTIGLLVACGDNEETTTSEPEDADGSVEEEATEPDEVEEPESDEPENNEHATEENEVEQEEAQATEGEEDQFKLEATEYEDQELEFGETGIYESTAYGTLEITPHTIHRETEIQGEAAPFGEWIIVETTIKNIGDETTKDMIPSPTIFDDVGSFDAFNELSSIDLDLNETKYYHEEQYLEPGETVELEILFAVNRFNEYEFVYGTEIDHDHSNRVSWKLDTSELE